jgi:hypothetical protein
MVPVYMHSLHLHTLFTFMHWSYFSEVEWTWNFNAQFPVQGIYVIFKNVWS